ncbi:MAG: hypothetical protein P4K92_05740, partial [Candidatus Nitrosotalea sp.]|nr:hypothetical protein [Candidatus Nitrosotalea sp.]
MKNKAMILFAFTALLMFSQYAFPNSFADNNTATAYSVSYLNATSTASITPATYQSSSDTSSSSSTVQAVATQPATVQAVATQPATTQSAPVQTVPIQSVSTQPSSTPSVPVQAAANQSSNTWNRGVTQSHSSHTAPSAGVSNYTPSQRVADNPVSSQSSSPLQTISGQWANNQVSDSTFIQNA